MTIVRRFLHLPTNITITVMDAERLISEGMARNHALNLNHIAFCEYHDGVYNLCVRHDHPEGVLSLIHELVHVNQIETKRLTVKDGHVMFDGIVYESPFMHISNGITGHVWNSFPWEKEANSISWEIYEVVLDEISGDQR